MLPGVCKEKTAGANYVAPATAPEPFFKATEEYYIIPLKGDCHIS